jgi:hypothetical protein
MQFYVELSADTASDPQVLAAYEYWQHARRNKTMPGRKDIDPIDLKFCLGWLSLVDVLYKPARRFRYRLDGSQLTQLTGWDLTGRYLEEMKDEVYREFVSMIYNRVTDTGIPIFMRNFEEWKTLRYLTESVTLPLSDDGEKVTGLMDVIIPKRHALSQTAAPVFPKVHRR